MGPSTGPHHFHSTSFLGKMRKCQNVTKRVHSEAKNLLFLKPCIIVKTAWIGHHWNPWNGWRYQFSPLHLCWLMVHVESDVLVTYWVDQGSVSVQSSGYSWGLILFLVVFHPSPRHDDGVPLAQASLSLEKVTVHRHLNFNDKRWIKASGIVLMELLSEL